MPNWLPCDPKILVTRCGLDDAQADQVKFAIENAYRRGYIAAIQDYSIWHNGEQFIGVLRQPLKERIVEVEKSRIEPHQLQ